MGLQSAETELERTDNGFYYLRISLFGNRCKIPLGLFFDVETIVEAVNKIRYAGVMSEDQKMKIKKSDLLNEIKHHISVYGVFDTCGKFRPKRDLIRVLKWEYGLFPDEVVLGTYNIRDIDKDTREISDAYPAIVVRISHPIYGTFGRALSIEGMENVDGVHSGEVSKKILNKIGPLAEKVVFDLVSTVYGLKAAEDVGFRIE